MKIIKTLLLTSSLFLILGCSPSGYGFDLTMENMDQYLDLHIFYEKNINRINGEVDKGKTCFKIYPKYIDGVGRAFCDDVWGRCSLTVKYTNRTREGDISTEYNWTEPKEYKDVKFAYYNGTQYTAEKYLLGTFEFEQKYTWRYPCIYNIKITSIVGHMSALEIYSDL